jgi:hypothetical protein
MRDRAGGIRIPDSRDPFRQVDGRYYGYLIDAGISKED